MPLPKLLTVLGLVADIAGALVLGWGVFALSKEKIAMQTQAFMLEPRTLEEKLRRPGAMALLVDRSRARAGVALLVAGFGLQLAGALCA